MHAKLCLKQDGNYDLYYENDIARFASVLKRGGTVFFKLAWKNGSVLFIDATHRMSFSFSRFLVRPASLAEHASIKEKMRKHLRKSAFVSDEQGELVRGKSYRGAQTS